MNTNNTIKVSVIIPTYHPQHHTVDCLASVKQQTLDASLYEVIVVLNGEREPYESILCKNLPSNGRLLYSPVASACSSRNKGIDEAKGEYICFIDDDDEISPTYLEELLKCVRQNVIAASYCLSLFEDGHTTKNTYSQEYERHARLGEHPFYRSKKIFSVPWMKLIHRDIIGTRRFNESFPSGQDALLMFEISDKMEKVRFTSSEAIYYWRQRSNSLHRLNPFRRFSKYGRLAWAYTCLYFRHPLRYNFYFYVTRLLASCHAIMVGK